MTTGDIRAAAAERAVRGFSERHDARTVALACFAALPVALDPDLLHLIRVNFFPGLRFTAESSLLLSRLCVEIGDGLYEMPPETRALLLRQLFETQPPRRVQQMAALLWEYSAGGAWPDNEQLARAQQLTALNLLAPEKARAWLDEAEAQRRGGPATAGAREWFVAMRAEVQWQTDVTAAAQPPAIAKAAMFELGGLMPFIRALNEYFNLTELKSLSFDLGVYFDELPGDTKSSKARELALYLWRQDRIDELQEAIRRVRPALGDLVFAQPPQPVAPEPVAIDPAALAWIIPNLFSPDEFQMLLLELHVVYDDLPGATERDKVRELILYLERYERLAELQALVRRDRPDAYDAAAGVASSEQSPAPAATASRLTLNEVLTVFFNLDEPQDLAITSDIEWEDLSGDSRQDKARELVSFLEQRGLLNPFLDYLRREQPAAYAALLDQPLSFPTKQFLAIDERQQLADVLSRTTWLQSPAAFQLLLSQPGLGRFAPALQVDSPPRVLAAELISRLEPFGVLPEQPTYHSLGALLDFILRDAATPPEDARFLAGLIVKHRLVAGEAYLDSLQTGYELEVAGRQSSEGASPTTAHLRQFIIENFSEDELAEFCLNYFPWVLEDFSRDMGVSQKALTLITFADRDGQMDTLRAALARTRPEQWSASNKVARKEGLSNQKPLSERQENILRFIREYMSDYGRAPTIREIGKAVDIKSTSVVNYNLSKLEEKGYLVRDPDVSRGLQLVSASPQLRDPRQVFISHATPDAEFAHRLAGGLQAEGWRIWIAPDNIRTGEAWLSEINRGLAESGVYLLILSPTAAKSGWVFWETSIAIDREQKGEMRFISILHQPGSFPATWQAYQSVDFERDYDAGLKELLSRLRAQRAEALPGNAATPPTEVTFTPAPQVGVQQQLEVNADNQKQLELWAFIVETLGSVRPSVPRELQLQRLEPLLEQVIEQLKREAPNNVVVSFNSSLPTFSYPIDPPLFEALLSNLIHNAWEAIPEGRDGRVEVTLEEHDNQARIAIRDNGVGIAEPDRDRIFESSHSTEQSDKAKGRGLMICSMIAQLHGGQLTLGPSDGTGTTFFIDLPVIPNQA